MMELDPWIEAQLASERPDVFWSIEVPIAGGSTLYLADRSVYAGGNLFQGALLAVDDIQSLSDPDEKTADVPSLNVVVDGAPRILPDNRRFSYYIDRFFQSRLIDAYLNVVGALGNKRVRMFLGVPRRPISRGYDNTTFRLASAMEFYLGKALCRAVKRDATHYPELRLADVGRAIPFVIGGSTDEPFENIRAIMRRPRQASMPTPDPGNAGTASLGRPTIKESTRGATWTVTALEIGESKFEGPADYYPIVGYNTEPRTAFAQPFVAADDHLDAIGLMLRFADGQTDPGPFSGIVSLHEDSGSDTPGSFVSATAVTLNASQNTLRQVWADFPGLEVTIGDTYWIVFRGWGSIAGGMIVWANRRGAGGGALIGDYDPADDYARPPSFTDWTLYNNSTFLFEVVYEETPDADISLAFAVSNSAQGAQGTGRFKSDYFSPNLDVVIPSALWSGLPAPGDIWTFTTPVLPAQLVFCETGPLTASFPEVAPGMPGFTWVDIALSSLNPRDSDGQPLGDYTPFPFAYDGIGYVGMIETMDEVTEEDEIYADLTIATFGTTVVDESSPVDQAMGILRRAGVPEEYIDFSTHGVTKAALAALDWTTGGMVNEPGIDAKAVLLSLAFQSRCRFEWIRDKARFRFIEDETTLDLLIPKAKVRLRSGTKVPNIRLDQVDAPRIVNVINLRYDRDWSQSSGSAAFRAIVTKRDEISIASFEERSDDAFFLCDFVTDADVADLLASFWLAKLAYPKDIGFAELTLDMAKLEPGDVIAFDLPEE